MKKAFAVTLILMAILTVIYVSAVVSKDYNPGKNNANYDSDSQKDFYDKYDNIVAAYEYQSETPPTTWYTMEELGIYDVLELGEENDSWLHIAVVSKQGLESAIFLYEDKFYQVSRYPWLNRYVGYTAFKYKENAPPSVWYTPEQLGIHYVEECGENASWLRISVDQAKEPSSFPFDAPDDDLIIFLYKDEFYTVSRRSISFECFECEAMPWQIPIGGALGAGWIFTGALFLKRRKKE